MEEIANVKRKDLEGDDSYSECEIENSEIDCVNPRNTHVIFDNANSSEMSPKKRFLSKYTENDTENNNCTPPKTFEINEKEQIRPQIDNKSREKIKNDLIAQTKGNRFEEKNYCNNIGSQSESITRTLIEDGRNSFLYKTDNSNFQNHDIENIKEEEEENDEPKNDLESIFNVEEAKEKNYKENCINNSTVFMKANISKNLCSIEKASVKKFNCCIDTILMKMVDKIETKKNLEREIVKLNELKKKDKQKLEELSRNENHLNLEIQQMKMKIHSLKITSNEEIGSKGWSNTRLKEIESESECNNNFLKKKLAEINEKYIEAQQNLDNEQKYIKDKQKFIKEKTNIYEYKLSDLQKEEEKIHERVKKMQLMSNKKKSILIQKGRLINDLIHKESMGLKRFSLTQNIPKLINSSFPSKNHDSIYPSQ